MKLLGNYPEWIERDSININWEGYQRQIPYPKIYQPFKYEKVCRIVKKCLLGLAAVTGVTMILGVKGPRSFSHFVFGSDFITRGFRLGICVAVIHAIALFDMWIPNPGRDVFKEDPNWNRRMAEQYVQGFQADKLHGIVSSENFKVLYKYIIETQYISKLKGETTYERKDRLGSFVEEGYKLLSEEEQSSIRTIVFDHLNSDRNLFKKSISRLEEDLSIAKEQVDTYLIDKNESDRGKLVDFLFSEEQN
ncbi:MAG: hypothetical protein Tsb0021_04870 [Chlamydiales bacterium]